ncbi:hypothetical protein [Hydrocarboniphaga sp.]|uniref:hypothetical protein n=1 Tax=Hydrocarboniphaga sp. TaxID=2033016 RepID=UPI003D0ED8B2
MSRELQVDPDAYMANDVAAPHHKPGAPGAHTDPQHDVPTGDRFATSAEHIWLELMLVMGADNGDHQDWAAVDMREAVPAITELQKLGFFADDPANLDSSFWQCASGEHSERLEYFASGLQHLQQLDVVINRVFDGESIGNPDTPFPHADDEAVDRFAAAMKAKLAKARAKGRGGWDDLSRDINGYLARELLEHLFKGNAGTFEDIANFAMMLHQRGADPSALQRVAPLPLSVGYYLSGAGRTFAEVVNCCERHSGKPCHTVDVDDRCAACPLWPRAPEPGEFRMLESLVDYVSHTKPTAPIDKGPEFDVIHALGSAWNLFLQLPAAAAADRDDLNDFRKAIHDAQRIVAFSIAARNCDFLRRVE